MDILPPCDHDDCSKLKCTKPPTFIAEKSNTNFELTEEEKQRMHNLLVWQEMSQKSIIKL